MFSKLYPIFFFLFFVATLFIRQIVFWSKDQTFIFGDTAIAGLYVASLAQNLHTVFGFNDNFLFWNPYYLSVGMPTLSMIEAGFLYPPNWILALLARLSGDYMNAMPLMSWSVYLHLVFGSYFVYRLLIRHWKTGTFEALIAGFIWSFIGFNTEFAASSPVLFAASYLPCCLYFTLNWIENKNKSSFVAMYLLLAMSFLAGYPMVSLLIFFSMSVLQLSLIDQYSRRTLLKTMLYICFGFFLITVPLIAPQYITTALSFSNTVRTSLSLQGFLQNAADIRNIMEMLIPTNLNINTNNRFNQVYLYFSIVGILIILQGGTGWLRDKKNQVLIAIALICFVLSIGSVTSVATTAFFLPAISLFRRLSVFSVIPLFVLCIIAAQAFSESVKKKDLNMAGVFVLKSIFVVVLFFHIADILKLIDVTGSQKNVLFQSVGFSLIIGIMTYVGLKIYPSVPTIAKIIVIVALFIEGGSNISGKFYLNSPVNPALVFRQNQITEKLQEYTHPGERVEIQQTQHVYNSEILKLEQTNGYTALASKYGVFLTEKLNAADSQKQFRDLLGVSSVVLKDKNVSDPLQHLSTIKQRGDFYRFNYDTAQWETDAESVSYSIFRNNSAFKRIFIAKKTTPFEQTPNVLTQIASNNPREVYLGPEHIKEATDTGTTKITSYHRNSISAIVKSDKPVFLANSTGYYFGWFVKINGTLHQPLQTNWFMMGSYLPPGTNVIEWVYIPIGFIVGFAYGFFALSLWGIILIVHLLRTNTRFHRPMNTQQELIERYKKLYASDQENLYKNFFVRSLFNLGHHYIARKGKNINGTILDVGCGIGYHLQFEQLGPKRTYICLDANPGMLEKIENKNVQKMLTKSDSISLKPNTVDLIIASHILEHIHDLPKTLKEFNRVLKPNGTLLVVLPCDPGFLWNLLTQLSPSRARLKKIGIDYEELMKTEHVNNYLYCKEQLSKIFEVSDLTYYPLGLKNHNLNILSCLELRKKR